MLNEDITKKYIRDLIKKELKKSEQRQEKATIDNSKKEFEKFIKDSKFEKKLEELIKSYFQGWHDMFYREPFIIKSKFKRRK